ncbi:hypothetical protein [Microbispora hainanensis]|uniref:hypothetical protein n=1 Tax=Microbispora hainanensis TaxID=568844 RepID=UPI00324F9C4F
MRDPVTEDAYEQDGSYLRPYIPGEGQYGGEGDRFWSEEQDEHALGGAPGDQGDVLSEGWRPEQPAQTPADHADQDDYAAGRMPRFRSEEPSTGEEYGTEYGRTEYAGGREYTGDGDTDPRGFLGSGWRNAPDEDDDDDRPRRGGMLLRAGLIAVGALGVIWALALWVGQPSGDECAGGTDCTAKAGTAATAPASPAADDAAAGDSDAVSTDEPVDEAIDEPTDEPTGGVPTDAPTSAPAQTRPATSGTSAPTASSAPTHASRSHAQDPGSQGGDTPRPSRSRVAVDTNDHSSAGDRSDEQTSGTDTGDDTDSTSDPATEQPTSAPAPTQESSGGRGGGLFGWLFG